MIIELISQLMKAIFDYDVFSRLLAIAYVFLLLSIRHHFITTISISPSCFHSYIDDTIFSTYAAFIFAFREIVIVSFTISLGRPLLSASRWDTISWCQLPILMPLPIADGHCRIEMPSLHCQLRPDTAAFSIHSRFLRQIRQSYRRHTRDAPPLMLLR